MSYNAGDYYRKGWADRLAGNPVSYEVSGILLDEYMKGYNDCHANIVETEKNSKMSKFLNGHPLYKEAHEQSSKTFLSD